MAAAAARGIAQVLLVAGLTAVIAACSQGAAPTVPPAPSSTLPADAASPSATPGGIITPASQPPLGTCASQVRFCLPEQFAVLPLVKERLDPATFLAGTKSGPGLQSFIESQGRTVSDLEIARSRDVTGTVGVTFFAFRVRGITGLALGDAFAQAAIGAGEDVVVATIVGRTVARYVGPAGIEYLYPSGDVLYAVQGATEKIASDALAVLP